MTKTKETDESVLREAERIINGAREKEYGTPEDSFTLIGELWEVADRALEKKGAGACNSPRAVAIKMVLLKIARDIHGPKRDNEVDIAGYAGCMERIRRKR